MNSASLHCVPSLNRWLAICLLLLWGHDSWAAEQEQSVNPGINDNFLEAGLEVGQWVERFEREGREVYDQRMAVLEGIDLKTGEAIADVGAGTGLYTGLFSDKVGPQGKVMAVDIVPLFSPASWIGPRKQGVKYSNGHEAANLPDCQPALTRFSSATLAIILSIPKVCLHRSIRRSNRWGNHSDRFQTRGGTSSGWILSHVRADRRYSVPKSLLRALKR